MAGAGSQDEQKGHVTADASQRASSLAAEAHQAWLRRAASGTPAEGLTDWSVAFDQLNIARQQYLQELVTQVLLSAGCVLPTGGGLPAAASENSLDRRINDRSAGLSQLWTLWQEGDRKSWSADPRRYAQLAERLLRLGSPFLATEVINEGLSGAPADLRLRQLLGLALAKLGDVERANRILADLDQQGHADEETLGILASTHKHLGAIAGSVAQRRSHLRTAYQLYSRAYQQYESAWTGINAATVSLLLGDQENARQLARRIHEDALEDWQRQAPNCDPLWQPAMLGEASLILDDGPQAEAWYGKAADAAAGRWGDLVSLRRQARLILRHYERDDGQLDSILRIPKVAVFVGHMIDQPSRKRARFPNPLAPAVAASIDDRLAQLNVQIGYASAACGSDLLFHEAIHRRGGESHVVLPYEAEQFVRDSVDIVPGADWTERFSAVLRQAATIVTTSRQKMEYGGVSYDYANLVLHGLATVRADELQTDLVGMAVWDGQEGDGGGGTATVVNRWKALGVTVDCLDSTALLREHCPDLVEKTQARRSPLTLKVETDVQVLSMLFADAVHYSKLTEEQVPRFVQYFLGAIADLARRSEHASVVRNTWGDGIYFVFETVRAAGVFALDLCDLVTKTNWAEKRLPPTLNLRIALHAGPVYRCEDPITGQTNCTGTHVSQAARIEPITPPGHVYASQGFAALAAVDKVQEFTCEYVKLMPLAKDYGTFPTYLVKRARPIQR